MAKSRLERTAAWAWNRDETGRQVTKQTVGYTVIMYSLAFAVTVTIGVVLSVYGYRGVGLSLLIFGTWFTGFMGSVNIVWEWLKYREQNRDKSTDRQETGPDRELAPEFSVRPDTWIGFIVTIIALISLVLAYQLSFYIIKLI